MSPAPNRMPLGGASILRPAIIRVALNMDPRKPITIDYPATEAGLQRWDWDLHRDDVRCINEHNLFEAMLAHRYRRDAIRFG